jgi:hypothetical protein
MRDEQKAHACAELYRDTRARNAYGAARRGGLDMLTCVPTILEAMRKASTAFDYSDAFAICTAWEGVLGPFETAAIPGFRSDALAQLRGNQVLKDGYLTARREGLSVGSCVRALQFELPTYNLKDIYETAQTWEAELTPFFRPAVSGRMSSAKPQPQRIDDMQGVPYPHQKADENTVYSVSIASRSPVTPPSRGHKLGCPTELYVVASELRSLLPFNPVTADVFDRARRVLSAFYACTCEKDLSNDWVEPHP